MLLFRLLYWGARSTVVGVGVACALALSLTPTAAAEPAAMEFSLEEVDDPPSPPVGGPGAQIEAALQGMRWGMSRKEVLSKLRKELEDQYRDAIRGETDTLRQDALFQRLRLQRQRLGRGVVVFNGRVTGWDVSQIADEFRHGSNESMLVLKRTDHRAFYFFINDKLWKIYREYSPAALGADSFEDAAGLLSARFGRGRPVTQPRAEGSNPMTWVQWSGKGTRLSALDRGSEICIVLEDERVLGKLALLRRDAKPRHADAKHTVVEGILISDSERERLRHQESRSPVDDILKR